MSLTFLELKQLTKTYVSEVDDSYDRMGDGTNGTSDELGMLVNIEKDKLLEEADWSFLETTTTSITTVAGTQGYNIPANIRKVTGVWLDSRKPNNRLTSLSYEKGKDLDATTQGVPTQYYTWGGKINLITTPGKAYTLIVEGILVGDDMEEDDDYPPYIPGAYHYLIALGTAIAWKKTSGGSEVQEAGALEGERLAGVDRMKRNYLDQTNDGFLTIDRVFDDPTGNYTDF